MDPAGFSFLHQSAVRVFHKCFAEIQEQHLQYFGIAATQPFQTLAHWVNLGQCKDWDCDTMTFYTVGQWDIVLPLSLHSMTLTLYFATRDTKPNAALSVTGTVLSHGQCQSLPFYSLEQIITWSAAWCGRHWGFRVSTQCSWRGRCVPGLETEAVPCYTEGFCVRFPSCMIHPRLRASAIYFPQSSLSLLVSIHPFSEYLVWQINSVQESLCGYNR